MYRCRLRGSLALVALLAFVTACTAVGPTTMASPSTFVVPTAPPAGTPKTLANASYKDLHVDAEVQQVFELVYQARSLRPGGKFAVEALHGLVSGAYADYTLPLFDREVADAQAGILQQVTFKDIVVKLDQYGPFEGGALGAFVHVTRTRVETRAGAAPANTTATYEFRMVRNRVGTDGVSWVVNDFRDPSTGRWLTDEPPPTEAVVANELKDFFEKFYEARTLMPGHPLDLKASFLLV